MPDVRPNKLGITDAAELVRAEGDLAGKRLIELRGAPIRGSFDIRHLQAVNHHIFQDIYPDAGELRTIEGLWVKGRSPAGLMPYAVYYKPAEEMRAELPGVIERAKASPWESFATPDKLAPALATLYGNLDYQHGFADGNSRTLRAFTQQWVEEKTEHHLSWGLTGASAEARDALYLARDLEVLSRASADNMIASEQGLRGLIRVRAQVQLTGETLPRIVERGLSAQPAQVLELDLLHKQAGLTAAESDQGAYRAVAQDFETLALNRSLQRPGFTDRSSEWQQMPSSLQRQVEWFNRQSPDIQRQALNALSHTPSTAADLRRSIQQFREVERLQDRGR